MLAERIKVLDNSIRLAPMVVRTNRSVLILLPGAPSIRLLLQKHRIPGLVAEMAGAVSLALDFWPSSVSLDDYANCHITVHPIPYKDAKTHEWGLFALAAMRKVVQEALRLPGKVTARAAVSQRTGPWVTLEMTRPGLYTEGLSWRVLAASETAGESPISSDTTNDSARQEN